MGIDAGTDYVFSVAPGGKPCHVTELSQGYSANFGGSTGPVLTTQCLLAGPVTPTSRSTAPASTC